MPPAACSAAFGWRPHTVPWPRLPFNPRIQPCPLRARQEERPRVVTVTQRQTTKIPQVTESAGGSATAPQTSQADSAGSTPVTRYDTKLWMRDLMEGAAYLPK